MDYIQTELQWLLFEMQDQKYKLFMEKLIPTVDPALVIGIRTPILRKLAKDYAKTSGAKTFLKSLPHRYFEENNLHAFLIENIKEFDETMTYTEAFLPFIDNWATCDLFSPKIFKKHPAEVYEKIKVWLASDHVYTIRYGIGLLLGNFLDSEFLPEMPALITRIRSEEYYVKMMIAWYFATALVKQYEAAMPVFLERRLAPWTHNKAIQKALESYRVDDETKAYLRTLKISLAEKRVL